MEDESPSERKAQLGKAEREHLEDIVEDLRERVEDNVRFQLRQRGLDDEPAAAGTPDEETRRLAEAIERERGSDGAWEGAFEQYVTGVGYTIVNRLAALRCMEVRDFLAEEVTVFKENGLTPAAETLVHEEFLVEEAAILRAYHDACDGLADEIEILFDRSSVYSLVDPDHDAFEAMCGMLDEVPDDVWRADDVLGWVYEYYNTNQLSGVRERMRTGEFDAADVAVANQFYTPHWVARLLTDNAVGKAHLRTTGEADRCIRQQRSLSPSQRTNRDPGYDASPSLAELCTYLVPSTVEGPAAPRDPSELRVLDPACGSGHFLLYAFDVLERIWRTATDTPPGDIPAKILEHNLYGIDIDMRACQLAAFNLYLKARGRAANEGNDAFEMPSVGIVCADNQISDTSQATELIDELSESNSDFGDALETVLADFRANKGLGSLLDVRGTLEAESASDQTELTDWLAEIPSLSDWIERLHEEVERQEADRFLYQSLQSFLRLVQLLTSEYDAILMNPPYGGHRRMPKQVKEYVEEHYAFKPEYYANFLEQSERLLGPDGRIGMLVPRSFMYKESFEDVREELVEPGGEFDFDFLVEFGEGILDNATVRTVGTVLTNGQDRQETGEFVQLSDVEAGRKEETFARLLGADSDLEWRHYSVPVEEFQQIPGGMLTYWTPSELRALYTNDTVFDASQADLSRDGIGAARKGIDTGNNDRYVRKTWECERDDSRWRPYAKGGERSWFHYPDSLRVLWGEHGREIARNGSSTIRNRDFQGRPAVTWPLIKDSGHRFATFDSGGISDNGGPCFYPDSESTTYLTALLNSTVYTGLMLAQTPERQWNLSDIAILPYFDLADGTRAELEEAAADLATLVERLESFRLASGAYRDTLQEYTDFEAFATARRETIQGLLDDMRHRKAEIDGTVARELDLGESTLDRIEREAELRYGSYEAIPYGPEFVGTGDADFCRRLLSHIVLEAVRNSDSGIIDLTSDFSEGHDLYDAVTASVRRRFEAPVDDVLVRMDGLLGSQSAEERPYPNIEHWIRESFFESHVSAFANTPVALELTTVRSVPDPVGKGFHCLVDYHALGPSLFDRLETQYLEPRKAELRERRNAADRRRSDDSLTATERAAAVDTYDRCESGLEQIAGFRESLQALVSGSPRDWTREDRDLASNLRDDVERLRERTEERLREYELLLDQNGVEWFEDTFSPSFLETFRTERAEWLDALAELESAASAYSRPAEEPVAARRRDLLTYFGDDLMGSVWPTSTGILSIGYYPGKQADELLDEHGDPKSSLTDENAERLARIAAQFDDYESLAEDVESQCTRLAARIPDDWDERALADITTAGYEPKQKYGVRINAKPLVEAGIVPETVDERVI